MNNITVNGKTKILSEPQLISDWLKHNAYLMEPMAIAINRQVIAQADHHKTWINAGDEIDILTAMQGG